MTVKTKICGLTDLSSIDLCANIGVDFLGFVFFEKSPRSITPEKMNILDKKDIIKNAKTVAVTVNASDEYLDKIFASHKFDYIQCHGDETIERIVHLRSKYKCKIIRAFKIACADDIAESDQFQEHCDYFLFDAKAPFSPIPGGNGLKFDWNLLKNRNLNKEWFLSGGLNPNNIVEAINLTNAKMVDVSSSLESSPGVKDLNLIKKFVTEVKSI